jgi:hypothetical protein
MQRLTFFLAEINSVGLCRKFLFPKKAAGVAVVGADGVEFAARIEQVSQFIIRESR